MYHGDKRAFLEYLGGNVSRETLEKFDIYYNLLLKWQKKINLISRSGIDDVYRRHFLDSAQLIDLIDDRNAKIVDFGSGAGFPGMILSILGCRNIILIERDGRKASFLRCVAREADLSVHIFEGDINNFDDKVDVIVSRALASLSDLLSLSYQKLSPDGCCLFLKGKNYSYEINEALKCWGMTFQKKGSITSIDSVILRVSDIRPLF